MLMVVDCRLTSGDLHVQDGSQTTAEKVVIKALLNAPDQAVQLLLDAEQRGEVRYSSNPTAEIHQSGNQLSHRHSYSTYQTPIPDAAARYKWRFSDWKRVWCLACRQPSQAARPEPTPSGNATLADEIASAQNGAGPLLGNINKPDAREALAYGRAHSPDEDALLEFTERWLEQVGPSCKASMGPNVSAGV